jgi:tRNA threonylcarbamoyladenosine biosynthesis protein TsaE
MHVINSLEEMHNFGANLGKKLKAGDLLLLSGPLGSGKTALTQGIGQALGFKQITSPTFVISKIYKGAPNLIHVDAYRLQGEASALFDDLDLESYLPSSITVVEWGEGFVDRIADKYLEIKLEHGEGENQRKLNLIDHGLGISL